RPRLRVVRRLQQAQQLQGARHAQSPGDVPLGLGFQVPVHPDDAHPRDRKRGTAPGLKTGTTGQSRGGMVEATPDVCSCGPDAPRTSGGTAGVCSRCGKPIPPAAALPASPAPPAAATPPLTGADPNLGIEMILFYNGWATTEQIHAGRRMQEEELAKGRKIRIGEALVELKILTPERVKEALLLQDKIPMRCVPCGKTFNVRGLKPGSRALCTTCKTPLVPAGT